MAGIGRYDLTAPLHGRNRSMHRALVRAVARDLGISQAQAMGVAIELLYGLVKKKKIRRKRYKFWAPGSKDPIILEVHREAKVDRRDEDVRL